LAQRLNQESSTDYFMGSSSDYQLVLEVEGFSRLPVVTYDSSAARELVELNQKLFTLILISQFEGKQMGRKERLLGAMGTIMMPFTPFCRIGPPAESE
jgi:hypothetical protein